MPSSVTHVSWEQGYTGTAVELNAGSFLVCEHVDADGIVLQTEDWCRGGVASPSPRNCSHTRITHLAPFLGGDVRRVARDCEVLRHGRARGSRGHSRERARDASGADEEHEEPRVERRGELQREPRVVLSVVRAEPTP